MSYPGTDGAVANWCAGCGVEGHSDEDPHPTKLSVTSDMFEEPTKTRFIGVREVEGKWEGVLGLPLGSLNFVANPTLFIIREAWDRGLDLEAEADGFGQGTHGDWSAIRDSSQDAVNAMLTKALNHLFGGSK